ncbi:MAG: hypothetical protein J6J23_06340 [Clostridia bacterium]|nr:hypothetical protein [Clostridia bacterium]
MRQEYNNSSSNSDFNRKRIRSKEHIEGGEEYLKSSYGRFADGSNASVLISSSFASENIVGGGQLRSNNYSASSRSIKGKRAYAHFKGGEGNYTSLMSSDFAGTETMLNPGNASFWNVDVSSRSDHIVGGGRNPLEASASGMQAELVFLDSSSRKGASRLVGRCVATSVGLFRRNLDVSFMRMSLLPYGHEMISLWKEVADI